MTDPAPDPPQSSMRRDILSAYLVTLTRILSWLFVSALVFRKMGDGAFATLALVRATVGVLNYSSLGIAPAMIRQLAQIRAHALHVVDVTPVSDPTEAAPIPVLGYAEPGTQRSGRSVIDPLQSLYFSGLVVVLILALVASIALCVYATVFAEGTLRVASGLRSEIASIVLLMGVGVLCRLVSDAPAAVLQTAGRITLDNFLIIAAEILWALLSTLWITDDVNDLPMIAGAFALANATLLFSRLVAAESFAPIFRNIKIETDWIAGAKLLTFGALVTLAQSADFFYAPTDYLLINQLLGPITVGTYAPAVQIDAGLLLLVAAVANVILPRAALAHSAGKVDLVRRYYLRGTLFSAALLLSAAIAVYFAGPLIFKLWLGSPMPATQAILPLVLIHTVVGGSSAVGRSILLGMGKVRPFTVAVLIAGASNVILSYIFVRHLNFGLRGIIYGTIIAVIARCAIWMPWYTLRALRQQS